MADPAIEEPGGCLPGFPIDMSHEAHLVHFTSSDRADSERAQRAQFSNPSTDVAESVRNIQLGVTSLKRVVMLIPGVAKTPELYRSESAKCTVVATPSDFTVPNLPGLGPSPDLCPDRGPDLPRPKD